MKNVNLENSCLNQPIWIESFATAISTRVVCLSHDCSEHIQKCGQDDEIHLILRFRNGRNWNKYSKYKKYKKNESVTIYSITAEAVSF